MNPLIHFFSWNCFTLIQLNIGIQMSRALTILTLMKWWLSTLNFYEVFKQCRKVAIPIMTKLPECLFVLCTSPEGVDWGCLLSSWHAICQRAVPLPLSSANQSLISPDLCPRSRTRDAVIKWLMTAKILHLLLPSSLPPCISGFNPPPSYILISTNWNKC